MEDNSGNIGVQRPVADAALDHDEGRAYPAHSTAMSAPSFDGMRNI
jgi:hypothetical protein